MELRALAERVLFGTELADKLAGPPRGEALTDEVRGPGLAPIPSVPGRWAALPLRSAAAIPRFPALGRLGEPAQAVVALHAFANHELLAAELMALALLRFPEAPSALRLELAHTLRDEQRHLSLYIARIEELGGRFGEAAASPFFWDCLAGAESVDAFVAGMSLTLEQANLDFAGAYAAAFAAVGDGETAAVLQRVLADEIVHVGRGVRHLRLLGGDLWETWAALLPAPLTPRRGRGPELLVAPRHKAGLDDAFIERLRWFAHSKGRPPDVYWFNPGCEEEIADERGQLGAALRGLERDLDTLPLALCGEDDVILVHRAPRAAFLAHVESAGLPIPELLVAEESAPLAGRTLGALLPFGWSPRADRRFAESGRAGSWAAAPGLRALHDKRRIGERLGALRGPLCDAVGEPRLLPAAAEPRLIFCPDEALRARRDFAELGFPHVVFKQALSASGRGQLRLLDEPTPTPPQRGWLERHAPDGLRVEPWLDRRLDLSLHFDACASGLAPRGVVRFEVDRTGRFRGATVGPATAGLPSEMLRFLTGDGRDGRWLERLARVLAELLGPEVAASGYTGPLGIDTFVYAGQAGLRLHPLVEINPRWTLGRIALALRGRVAAGRRSELRLVTPDEARRALAALPIERAGGRALRAGAIALNDPMTAERVVALWTVA